MLYQLEQRIEGVWRLLREVTSSQWQEITSYHSGSFRLVDPKSQIVEREFHAKPVVITGGSSTITVQAVSGTREYT